jgi:hypothetical protein
VTRAPWLAAGAAGLLAVGLTAGLARPATGPSGGPRSGSLAVTSTTLVCPIATGTPGAPAVASVASVGDLVEPALPKLRNATIRPLTATGKSREVSVRSVTRFPAEKTTGLLMVSAQGEGAAALAASQRKLYPRGISRGLLSATCQAPGTDWWITGAEGGVGFADALLVANPGNTVANVTVTAWATRGRFEPPRLQSLTVDPGRTVRLPVGDYAPDERHVTFRVQATSGRVTAIGVDTRFDGVSARGLDFIPPTAPPAQDVVVAGLPGGPGTRRLVVTNPGTVDATVELRVVRTDGNFAPAAQPSVVVRAGRSAVVDLTDAFDDVAGSIALDSDAPVVAAAITSLVPGRASMHPELQWTPAGLALSGSSILPDNRPPFGDEVRVYLCAPGAAASVRVTARDGGEVTVRIPAGRTRAFDPVAAFGSDVGVGPLVLTPTTGGAVYAARTLYSAGAHGPLISSGQPFPVPQPVVIPPAVSDDRAALD